ncbi:toxin [Streptomyces nanshensis]|nr:toxin [Streptomyces nanshensis]
MSDLVWVKSSYSGPGGGECVEVAVEWRRSSHSDSSGGACVEVAATPAAVHVRDSKRADGPALCLPGRSWRAFLTAL